MIATFIHTIAGFLSMDLYGAVFPLLAVAFVFIAVCYLIDKGIRRQSR
ncbi:hypothetical protein ACJ7K1_18095 [Paenibacillus elgii]